MAKERKGAFQVDGTVGRKSGVKKQQREKETMRWEPGAGAGFKQDWARGQAPSE